MSNSGKNTEQWSHREEVSIIASNAVLLFVSRLIALFLGFVVQVFLARRLQPENYGILSEASILVSLLALVAALGMPNVSARFLPIYGAQKDFGKLASAARLMLGFPFLLGMILGLLLLLFGDVVAIKFFGDYKLIPIIPIVVMWIPFTASGLVISEVYSGLRRVFGRIALEDIGHGILRLVFASLSAILVGRIAWVAGGFFLARFFTLIAGIIYISKYSGIFNKSFRSDISREIFSFALPVFITDSAWMIMDYADILLLGYFSTPDQVGIYRACHPLADLSRLAIIAFLFGYMPAVSERFALGDHNGTQKLYSSTAILILLLTIPITSFFALFAYEVVPYLFGESYIAGAIPLIILSLGYFVQSATGFNGATLVVYGKLKIKVIVDLAAIFSNIILNVLLIPKYGIIGAAVGTAMSLLMHNILKQVAVHYALKIRILDRKYFLTILSALISVVLAFSCTLAFGEKMMLLRWCIFGVVFFIVEYIAIRKFRILDMEYIKQLILSKMRRDNLTITK